MPTTRSSRSSTGAGPGKQSTLSFKHKVTKAIKTGKEGYKSPSRAKEYIPEPTPEPVTTTNKAKATKTPSPEEESPASTDDEQLETKVQPPAAAAQDKPAGPEAQAAEVTDRAIERYWSGIESSRDARAVHKKHAEGLSTGEKVLRYFDVSSQYGVRNQSTTTYVM